jgi:hypothetical protein
MQRKESQSDTSNIASLKENHSLCASTVADKKLHPTEKFL